MSEKKTSKQLLREVQAGNYEAIREAKARGEKIGYAAAQFPKELFECMDIMMVYPENHSAAVSAKNREKAEFYLETAENNGYAADLCSYSRINLGYNLANDPVGEGIDVPKPDFVVVGNNICSMTLHWYENLAWEYKIPYLFLDYPFICEAEVPERKIEYMTRQMEYIVHQIEEITGRKFDYDRYRETMAISSRNGELYREACDLIGQVPSPANGHDELNYMSLMVTMKGSPKTTEVLELWIEELKERIAKGETTFKGDQKYRILFDGVACWPQLKYCNDCMAGCGCNWVGAPYTDLFHQVYDDVREQVACQAILVCNSGMDAWQANRSEMIEKYKVDGILGNITRSCKPMIGKMPLSNRMLEKKYGIPSATFDGDQSDPRILSKAQFETRLQGLVEIMEQNKKEKEGA